MSAAAVALVLAQPLFAQVSLRLGGFSAQYADSITAEAGTVGLRVAREGRNASGILDASWSVFDSGSGAGQAWGSYVRASPGSSLGLRLDGVANVPDGGPWTANGTAGLFTVHRVLGVTMMLGGFAGVVRAVDELSRFQFGTTIRLRKDIRAISVSATLSGTRMGDRLINDQSLALDWYGGLLSLGAMAGSHGSRGTHETWAQLYGSAALLPSVSLEATAGGYPNDLVGYDRGKFVNLGLRVRLGPARPAEPASGVATAAAERAFRVETDGSGQVRLTVSVPAARTLAITGSWSDWTPVPLEPAGSGRWTINLQLRPGTYRFALIPDGGAWIVPEGVTRLPDDFGGEVGLLVVP